MQSPRSSQTYFHAFGRFVTVASLLCGGVLAIEASGGLEFREIQKRGKQAQEAYREIVSGDELYGRGSYREAISAYKVAVSKLTLAPKTEDLRAAALDRAVTASIQCARELSRKGDVEGAKRVVEDVLRPDFSPNSVEAKMMLDRLNDPIRTNPAVDVEHARNVDEVRRELYTAEGAMQLGKFEEAKKHYERVLKIDLHNTAAQRGIEQVNRYRSDYYRSAYDATRSTMLSETDGQWEKKPGQMMDMAKLVGQEQMLMRDSALSERTAKLGNAVDLSSKLEQIILPVVSFENASLEEALDFLRAKTLEYDAQELDSSRKGINFALLLGGGKDDLQSNAIYQKRFSLRLSNVSVGNVLKYLTEQTGTAYQVDEYTVKIVPAGSGPSGMMTRQFRVPSTFFATLEKSAAASQGDGGNVDPFASASNNPNLTLSVKKRSVKDALQAAGIGFEAGSSVVYNNGTQMLVVRNTKNNLDLLSSLVESAQKMLPVQVVVRVTMIKTEQQNLEELGFDWLLGPSSNRSGEVFATGGSQGNGTSLLDVAGNTQGLEQLAPITSGLRSGAAQVQKGIDDVLTNNSKYVQNGRNSRAPTALQTFGTVSDANFAIALRALDQKKGIDLLNVPSVVTKSGATAKLESVREFIYPTEYEAAQLPNSVGTNVFNDPGTIVNPLDPNSQSQAAPNSPPVTPATPSAFETKNLGVTLEVLPTVSEDHQFVDLDIKADYVDFDGFIDYGSPITSGVDVVLSPNAILMPVFSRLSEKTSVTVAAGQSIVMGGLVEERTLNVNDKVPILGDIPLFGRMFQNKGKNFVKKHVLFVVQVQVIDPSGQAVAGER